MGVVDIATQRKKPARIRRLPSQLGSLVQGGLEPPDALDRQDLGVASVLSRTDGQGADLAGCGVEEMNLHKSLYIGNKGYIPISHGSNNPNKTTTKKYTIQRIRGIHSYSLYVSPLPFLKKRNPVNNKPTKHKTN